MKKTHVDFILNYFLKEIYYLTMSYVYHKIIIEIILKFLFLHNNKFHVYLFIVYSESFPIRKTVIKYFQ